MILLHQYIHTVCIYAWRTTVMRPSQSYVQRDPAKLHHGRIHSSFDLSSAFIVCKNTQALIRVHSM